MSTGVSAVGLSTVSKVGKCACGDPACKLRAETIHPPGHIFSTSEIDHVKEPDPGPPITEIEGWRMDAADTNLIPWMYNTCTILSHYCSKAEWRQFLGPDEVINSKACDVCKEEIPDSVLTVWHLYNADEILKYSKAIKEWNKEYDDRNPAFVPKIWKDSGPIQEIELFDELRPLFLANGKTLDDEIQEWNGDTVVLFSHDETIIVPEDAEEECKDATSSA